MSFLELVPLSCRFERGFPKRTAESIFGGPPQKSPWRMGMAKRFKMGVYFLLKGSQKENNHCFWGTLKRNIEMVDLLFEGTHLLSPCFFRDIMGIVGMPEFLRDTRSFPPLFLGRNTWSRYSREATCLTM